MSSVFRFDRVLIAPEVADLEQSLTEAAQGANKGCRVRTVAWTPDDTRALLTAVAAAPAGFRQWNASVDVTRPRAGNTHSAVAVAWWTDPVRRVHYRVVGERVITSSSVAQNLITPYNQRPVLWLVHPDHVYFRGVEVAAPWVACPCGVTGSPASLGWMGLSCAACHDRAEDGVLPRTSGEPARTVLVGLTSWAGQVLFTPDGETVIAGGRSGGSIVAWDLNTGTMRELRPFRGDIPGITLFPDGNSIAFGSAGQVLRVDISTGQTLQTLRIAPASERLIDLTFSPDGSLLAVAPYGRVEVWDVASETQIATVVESQTGHRCDRYLAFTPDGATLVVGHGFRGGVYLWDVASRQGHNWTIPGISESANVVAVSPDGRTLGLINNPPGRVCLVDLPLGRHIVEPDARFANGLAFSPDGRLLAVAGHDHSLRLCSVPEGEVLAVFYWHLRNLNSVAFLPDGQWLATSSDDGYVKLWPVAALLAGE